MRWCFWSAILASIPYAPFHIAQPLIPGRFDALSVAIVLLAIILQEQLGARFSSSAFAKRITPFMPHACSAAACVVVFVEIIASLNGRAYLLSTAEIAANDAMMLAERACIILLLYGWATEAQMGEPHHDGTHFARSSIIAFHVGAGLPGICLLASTLAGAQPLAIQFGWCLSTAVAFFFAAMRWKQSGFLSLPGTKLLLCGSLCFQCFNKTLILSRAWGVDKYFSVESLCTAYLLTLLILLPILLAYVRRRECISDKAPTHSDASKRDTELLASEEEIRRRSQKTLTPRESSILARTALGLSVSEIARELSIAEATVATYRRRGYAKMGVSGAQELRQTIGTALMSPAPSEQRDKTRPSPRKSHRHLSSAVLLAALSTLLLVRWPNEIVLDSGDPFAGRVPEFGRYPLWIACALLCILYAWIAANRMQDPSSCPRSSIVSDEMTIALDVCALTLSADVYCTWTGYATYGMQALPIFLLASFIAGTYGCNEVNEESTHSIPNEVLRCLLAGQRVLLDNPAFIGVAITFFFIFDALNDMFTGSVSNFMMPVNALLITLLSALVMATLWRTRTQIGTQSLQKIERASLYLQGRGLSELQANVIIDLARGYDTKSVCTRNSTTLATIGSCKSRAYRKLGIHNIAELRVLLEREAGLTANQKTHAVK